MIRRTHSTADPVPTLGETLGPYRILGALGDGRLGQLYVAEQTDVRGLPNVVAVRHVRPELAANRRFRARFREAVRVATRCEHPNLVGVFELGDFDLEGSDERCLLSMEYLPGENVESILQRCSSDNVMPADIAAYVVKQAAAGLQYWRDVRDASPRDLAVPCADVRPSDVFVTHHGTVKCIAIGLRAIADSTTAGDAGVSSSAEVPRPASSDPAAARAHAGDEPQRPGDVTSLGRLLWICLTGKRPLGSAATSDAPSSVAELGPLPAGVPDALGRVARRALSLDPRESFDSPGAMADELDRYLFQRPSRPTPGQLRRWLEQLFGVDRALLQMRVVRGRDVQAALSYLGAALPTGGPVKSLRAFSRPRPRELWLTRQATFSQFGRVSLAPSRSFERGAGSAPDGFSRVSVIPLQHPLPAFEAPPSTLGYAELPARSRARERSSRATWAIGTLAGCSVLALAALVLVPPPQEGSRLGASARAADVSHGVSVRSAPAGAAVFIDGEPTGLSTPVVVRGLAAGRRIRVRVEKAGFQSQEQSLEVAAGSVAEHMFELRASTGQVHFMGVPPDARVYVDDGAVVLPGSAALELSVGSHTLRVETSGALLFSGSVDVVPGEQTIRIGERGP